MASQKSKRPAPRKKKRTSASAAAITSDPVAECGIGAPAGDLTSEAREVMEDNARALAEMGVSVASDPVTPLDISLPVLDAVPDEPTRPSAPKRPGIISRFIDWVFDLNSGR